MKRYIIKNEDGTTQTVMPAIHNTRKEALLTILHYATEVQQGNKQHRHVIGCSERMPHGYYGITGKFA